MPNQNTQPVHVTLFISTQIPEVMGRERGAVNSGYFLLLATFLTIQTLVCRLYFDVFVKFM